MEKRPPDPRIGDDRGPAVELGARHSANVMRDNQPHLCLADTVSFALHHSSNLSL